MEGEMVPHKGIYDCLIFGCLYIYSTMAILSSNHNMLIQFKMLCLTLVPRGSWIPQGRELLMVSAIAPTELRAWRVPESHY